MVLSSEKESTFDTRYGGGPAATLYCPLRTRRSSLLTARQNQPSALLSRFPSFRCAGLPLRQSILPEKPLVEALVVLLVMRLFHPLFEESLITPPRRPSQLGWRIALRHLVVDRAAKPTAMSGRTVVW